MWTKTRSLFLSRILTAAVTVLAVGAAFFVPYISSWYNDISVGNACSAGALLCLCA